MMNCGFGFFAFSNVSGPWKCLTNRLLEILSVPGNARRALARGGLNGRIGGLIVSNLHHFSASSAQIRTDKIPFGLVPYDVAMRRKRKASIDEVRGWAAT
jgi:hypothetical protein